MSKQPGPSAKLSIAILTIGFVVAIAATYFLYDQFGKLLDFEEVTTPATVVHDLPEGELLILESDDGPSVIRASDIEIIADVSGERVEVESDFGTEIDVGFGDLFQSVASAEIPREGDYRISVGGEASRVAFAPNPIGLLKRLIVPGLVMGVGSLLVILGAIMWAVGANRRRRDSLSTQQQVAQYPAPQPVSQPPTSPPPVSQPPTSPPPPPGSSTPW